MCREIFKHQFKLHSRQDSLYWVCDWEQLSVTNNSPADLIITQSLSSNSSEKNPNSGGPEQFLGLSGSAGKATKFLALPGSYCAMASRENLTKPRVRYFREDVTQQQKGAGAEFCLLFAAGLPSEQDHALAQLIVLGGRGQVWVFSLEKNEPLIYRK